MVDVKEMQITFTPNLPARSFACNKTEVSYLRCRQKRHVVGYSLIFAVEVCYYIESLRSGNYSRQTEDNNVMLTVPDNTYQMGALL